jgi:hypothetical protein
VAEREHAIVIWIKDTISVGSRLAFSRKQARYSGFDESSGPAGADDYEQGRFLGFTGTICLNGFHGNVEGVRSGA